jgi:hypothetical protein
MTISASDEVSEASVTPGSTCRTEGRPITIILSSLPHSPSGCRLGLESSFDIEGLTIVGERIWNTFSPNEKTFNR